MCNVFSGHIVTKKGKDWGKVLIVTGVHHEKDREHPSVSKYGEEIAAWETIEAGSLKDGVKLVHDCGQRLSSKEMSDLVEITDNFLKLKSIEWMIKEILSKSDNLELKGCTGITSLPDNLNVKGNIYKDF